MNIRQDAKTIGVLGGGFGRLFARAVGRAGHRARLYSRSGTGEDLPDFVEVTSDLGSMAETELMFVAVPSQHIRTLMHELAPHLDGRHMLVHVSRGILEDERGEPESISGLMRRVSPVRRVGVLGGPLGESVLAQGNPGAVVVGSDFPDVGQAVQGAVGSPTLRVYTSVDRIGVEVGSVLSGMLQFSIGFAQGLGFGPSTVGVLAARGISEATRLSELLGGQERTLTGLACVGDVLAGMAGDERPELLLGRLVGNGAPLDEALKKVGANVESTAVAARLQRYAERHGEEVPITAAVAAVLDGRLAGPDAVKLLMSRSVGRE